MEINKKTAGVSLIEVMISMVLIAILLMAVASVFPRMSSHRKAVQESDIAKDIATETLEYLQLYSENHKCSDGNNLSSGNVPDAVDPDVYPHMSYKKRWVGAVKWYTITWNDPCIGNGTNGYYPASITVSWKKQGKDHKVTVTGTVQ
jgi:prepilin-type N-terminal cleavage/methylation domain-containing protein